MFADDVLLSPALTPTIIHPPRLRVDCNMIERTVRISKQATSSNPPFRKRWLA